MATRRHYKRKHGQSKSKRTTRRSNICPLCKSNVSGRGRRRSMRGG